MRGCPRCHVRLNAPVQRLREHFGVLKLTEVSSVPTEMVMQRPMSKSHQLLQSRGLKTIFSDTRIALWCTRLSSAVQAIRFPRFRDFNLSLSNRGS